MELVVDISTFWLCLFFLRHGVDVLVVGEELDVAVCEVVNVIVDVVLIFACAMAGLLFDGCIAFFVFAIVVVETENGV